jgi:hypothetical protein
MGAIGLLLLLHLYIGWRIVPQLPGAIAGFAFAALLLASALLIPLGFFGRRAARREVADRWTWAGMLALGLFSMLLVLTLLRDALLLVTLPLELPALTQHSAAAVPLLGLAAAVAGFAGARTPPRGTSNRAIAATRRLRSLARRTTRPCACCSRTSRAAPRQRQTQDSTCSCLGIRMAASAGPGTCS